MQYCAMTAANDLPSFALTGLVQVLITVRPEQSMSFDVLKKMEQQRVIVLYLIEFQGSCIWMFEFQGSCSTSFVLLNTS